MAVQDVGSLTKRRRLVSSSFSSDSDIDMSPLKKQKSVSDESPIVYAITPDELLEDDNLQIIAETDPEECSDARNDKQTIPVRVLTDFTIYEMDTLRYVPIGELFSLQHSSPTAYGASGSVKAFSDEDDDDQPDVIDDDDGMSDLEEQRVKLSKIMELDVHNFDKRKLDSNIYIRTQYAWYILDLPSPIYCPFFEKYWVQHRVLHLVASTTLPTSPLYKPRITFDEFISMLKVTPESADAVAIALKILQRELNQDDVEAEDVKSYVIARLEDLRSVGLTYRRVPLIRTLIGSSAGSMKINDDEDDEDFEMSQLSSPTKKSRKINMEKHVLLHRNRTVVTPIVARVAKGLFQTLCIAGQPSTEDIELGAPQTPGRMESGDEASITWLSGPTDSGVYHSALINGVIYNVGDVVIIPPGEDDFKARARNAETERAQSTNSLANNFWFARIRYMFEDGPNKQFHAQWFTHSSKTILQETADAKELCLLNECADVMLSEVLQKANVRILGPEEDEPFDENPNEENDFYCRLVVIEENSTLLCLPTESETSAAFAHCELDRPCYPCGQRLEKEELAKARPLPGRGFSQFGINYHPHDFVYVRPNSKNGLYVVAQITSVKAMDNPVRLILDRYDWYGNGSSGGCSDNRHLVRTSKTIEVDSNRIDGKCFVKYLTDSEDADNWVRHDDHYFVNERPTGLRQCDLCLNERSAYLRRVDEHHKKHGPLRGMDLFSGAGGLTTGYDMSGFVDTRSAVEFSPSAAKTLQHNHPHVVVYNQDSNLLLQHAIDCDEGKSPPSITSLRDGSPLHPMPKRGEVDIIYGGPPCQAFSGANHHKKANDVRATLVCNTLSYVEHYRPSFFQMENVRGMLYFRLKGRQVGGCIVGGVEMGMMKFIYRALIALGYQVSFKVLQAAQYGAPQNRERVIVWAAKRGVPLPDFPVPTHFYEKAGNHYKVPTLGTIPPVTRSKDPDLTHQCAPLPPVTVNDAIGDLPSFDWVDPHQIMKATLNDNTDARKRLQDLGIAQFRAEPGLSSDVFPGFVKATPYAHQPLNRYQKWLRRGVSGNEVTLQYTRHFASQIIERVVNVPMEPDADHTDLPPKLRMNMANRTQEITKYHGLYGRINGNGHFRTALTTVAPNAKGGVLLHPSQKRIVTVRECARAQGFPDNYEFLSVNTRPSEVVQDQHRQIGNAVPIPLALALGTALGAAMLKMWEKEEREKARDGSPEV